MSLISSMVHNIDDVPRCAQRALEEFVTTQKHERLWPKNLEDRQTLRMALFPLVGQYFLKDHSIPMDVKLEVLLKAISEQPSNYGIDQLSRTYAPELKERINSHDMMTAQGLKKVVGMLNISEQHYDEDELKEAIHSSAWQYLLYNKRHQITLCNNTLGVTSDSHNTSVIFDLIQPIVAQLISDIGYTPFQNLLTLCIDQADRYISSMHNFMIGPERRTETTSVVDTLDQEDIISVDSGGLDQGIQTVRQRHSF